MAAGRAARAGLALLAALAAVLLAGAASGPERAGAAELKQCESTNPSGPIVELDGELSLEPHRATHRAWHRSRVRQRLIRPANNLAGRPAFPVRAVRYGPRLRVNLKGGIRLQRGRRAVAIRGLHFVSPRGRPDLVRGRIGRRVVNVFQVRRGKRTWRPASGEYSRTGVARLTAGAARLLNRHLGTGRKRLRAGMVWGIFNLYSLYKVTEVEDPSGETPEEPPVKSRPEGAEDVVSAATVKWYVRDSFIEYVASGNGTRVEDGATADPASGPHNLVYSFNFPFDSGWTVPDGNGASENTLIKGRGTVGFRYCQNTINFTASDPEIELDGEDNSRLIFRVNGTDATAFPNQRAVMVKLIPSLVEPSVVDNDDGTVTVSYEKIPGFVPAEGTGLFADIYPAYSPHFEGTNPRPDRFGYFSITYTYPDPDA